MMWSAYLVQTMTGDLGARLDLAEGGSWSIPLNGIEEWTVTVSKDQLRTLDPAWWKQHRVSTLVCYQPDDDTLIPWLLGPVIRPPEETLTMATLTCRGIGAILTDRVVLNRDHTNPAELAKSRVSRTGMSLGTIAQEVVKLATDAKTAGYLPITYRSPRETGSRLNTRNYYGWNLANNGAWKRLTEITRVINGPDIAFRPEWARPDRTQIAWGMWHGTSRQPTIAQTRSMSIDTTAHTGPISNVQITTSAENVCNRVYWTGAGEDAGTLIRFTEDRARMTDHTPLIERVGSTSDSANPDLIAAHAAAALADGAKPITQISVTIDGSDSRCRIGDWHVGDAASVTLGDDWLTVEPGTRDLRIIGARGSWGTDQVQIEFQDDGPIEYEEDNPDGAAT